ncbi:MAG TPA: hypothetical protein VFT90_15170, partial [Chryseosolibacter sp.]|nr:hypothetical protein [Chryseosolibacter sp.]
MKTSLHVSLWTSHHDRSKCSLHSIFVTSAAAYLITIIRYRLLSMMVVTAFCAQSLFAQGVGPELLGMAQYGGISINGTV